MKFGTVSGNHVTGSLLGSVESDFAEVAGENSRVGCSSGEDGRQRERVVFTRPVPFCHVFLILEGTAVQGRTAGSAGESGRHFVLGLFELVG